MASFDLTVLGSSGGPADGKTCAFLLKPSGLTFDQILDGQMNDCLLCVDAGTGISGFCEILLLHLRNRLSQLQKDDIDILSYYKDSLEISDYTSIETVVPFGNPREEAVASMGVFEYASKLFNLISAYLITHSHIDHVSGLLVNSPAFSQPVITSNSPRPRRVSLTSSKKIYSIPSAIDNIQNHLYNDLVWPDLTAAHTGSSISLMKLEPEQLVQLNCWFGVETFVISHGIIPHEHKDEMFESSAYLITLKPPKDDGGASADSESSFPSKLLFFGDVESDSTSISPRNHRIWREVAPLVVSGQLRAVVIECSNYNLPKTVPLFGHMTPTHLISEFVTLAKECSLLSGAAYHPLDGLHVLITHVKETDSSCDPRKIILQQLRELNDSHDLRLNFTIALPGLTYKI